MDGRITCFTLENTALIIPTGLYPVKLLMSRRFQRKTPHLDVPGRTDIEIHGCNRAEDLEGCIGVAEYRMSDYVIYESEPATNAIEEALEAAEANNEASMVQISASDAS